MCGLGLAGALLQALPETPVAISQILSPTLGSPLVSYSRLADGKIEAERAKGHSALCNRRTTDLEFMNLSFQGNSECRKAMRGTHLF